jgi:hypothetical protein
MLLFLHTIAHAGTEYVEVLSGVSRGPLNDPQPDYATVPLRIALTQDAEPVLNRIFGNTAPGRWEFQIEPFVDTVVEPNTNLEVGVALGLKYTFETGSDLEPYLKLSTGPMYTSQPTTEQATKFNFGSQGTIGLQWNISEGEAWLLETRLRHFSNASIETPNSGVDTNYFLVGYRWATRD